MNELHDQRNLHADAIRALIGETVAEAPDPDPFEAIAAAFDARSPRSAARRWAAPRMLVAAAAVAVLLAGATVVSTRRPAPMPSGMVVDVADVTPLSPAVLPADLQLVDASSAWWPRPRARVQRFVEGEADAAVRLTVVTEAGVIPPGMTPGDDGLRVLDGMNAATFSWVRTENGGVLSEELPGATVSLVVAGAGEERARAAVEEFTARSGDPFDGYDPVRGAGWRQVEDRSVAAGWMPVAQLRWEASGERSVYLSIAGDDGAVPLLAGASVVAVPAPVVEELAGRTVVRIGSVLRFVEGRTEVLLVAPGLSDAELGAVMGSLEPLSASEWAALRRTTADRLAATELLVESPVADADGGLVTAQLRRRGDEAVLCVRSGGQLDCSFVQISLAANGPLVPDASDALVFGVLRSGGRSWVVGTAGPDADSTVRLDLGERSIELVPTAAADGRRWYLWPVDEAALGDQLQLVLSGEGVVGGGSSPLALPR